jgi:hypothetical protein
LPSTISQVLAAILEITGAFAMFRFQSLKDSLSGVAGDFLDVAHDELTGDLIYRFKLNIESTTQG